MKAVKVETGEIKFSRKRPASVALQDIHNENCLSQDVVWSSKVPSIVATNQENQNRSPKENFILRPSNSSNMNTDSNNNNGVKEEEVSSVLFSEQVLIFSQ